MVFQLEVIIFLKMLTFNDDCDSIIDVGNAQTWGNPC